MAAIISSTLSLIYSPSKTASVSIKQPSKSLLFTTQSRRTTNFACYCAVATPKIEEIGSQISSLTLEEARSLVDYLQDRLGVSAAAFAPASIGRHYSITHMKESGESWSEAQKTSNGACNVCFHFSHLSQTAILPPCRSITTAIENKTTNGGTGD